MTHYQCIICAARLPLQQTDIFDRSEVYLLTTAVNRFFVSCQQNNSGRPALKRFPVIGVRRRQFGRRRLSGGAHLVCADSPQNRG